MTRNRGRGGSVRFLGSFPSTSSSTTPLFDSVTTPYLSSCEDKKIKPRVSETSFPRLGLRWWCKGPSFRSGGGLPLLSRQVFPLKVVGGPKPSNTFPIRCSRGKDGGNSRPRLYQRSLAGREGSTTYSFLVQCLRSVTSTVS